jgi:heme-degrading monooxygenase HmoA
MGLIATSSGRSNVTFTTLDDANTLVITSYVVAPADQQRLMDMLTALLTQVIRQLPGFVSTHIYKSSDGTRLVTYGRWQSQAAFEAMLHDDAVWRAFVSIGSIAAPDPRYYELAFVSTAASHSAAPS